MHPNGSTDITSSQDQLKQLLQERVVEYDNRYKGIVEKLGTSKARLVEQATEKGSSSWLSCLPLKRFGFSFNKSEFRDLICLRYGIQLARLPSKCACGSDFNIEHALNCHLGGFVIIRHNALRDFIADSIKSVQNDVEIEPPLQPLDNEQFQYRSALTGENARPDIRARGFYRAAQNTYFDIRVTNPNSSSYTSMPTAKVYEKAERNKIRAYNERILNLEHGSFVPLVFSVTGGMGKLAKTFCKYLCSKISIKRKDSYSDTVNLFRCKISFLICRMVLLCIRGSRTLKQNSNIILGNDCSFECNEANIS